MSGRTAVRRPLIAHVVFRFDYGGLENGLVNLINYMPEEPFEHCIIALTEATSFQRRLKKPTVRVYSLGKRAGKDFVAYLRLFRLLRKLRPDILHTRNVGTLDCVPIARLAGVPVCVHGEHGWDVHDPDGTNAKYRRLRKIVYPLLQTVIVVSNDLRRWIVDTIGAQQNKVVHICNGVDTRRFYPGSSAERRADLRERFGVDTVIVGSVLRFVDIKDPMNLVEAFSKAHRLAGQEGIELRLVMIGDGPLRRVAIHALDVAGLRAAAWLPGNRDDVPVLMQNMDLFVLGSRREGISNTLLEAMASGLPLIATDTGGNAELVRPGHNGSLVPPEDVDALAQKIIVYALDSTMRMVQGQNARSDALQRYSIDAMVRAYKDIYANAIAKARD